MKQFVVKRSPEFGLKSVECFAEDERVEASAAAELAELEGLKAKVFLGCDLIDVARSSPSWFAEGGQPAVGQAIFAKYGGRCLGCRGAIRVDDVITKVSGEWFHDECAPVPKEHD